MNHLLNPNGYWNKNFASRMRDLRKFGLVDIIIEDDTPTFICAIEKDKYQQKYMYHPLKGKLLMEIFPLYIGKSTFDDCIHQLYPPVISMNAMDSKLLDEMRKPLTAEICSSGYMMRCGEDRDLIHTRLGFGYIFENELVDWIWESLGCFEFIEM